MRVIKTFNSSVVEFSLFVRASAEKPLEIVNRSNGIKTPVGIIRRNFAEIAIEPFYLAPVGKPFSVRRIADDHSPFKIAFKVFHIRKSNVDIIGNACEFGVFFQQLELLFIYIACKYFVGDFWRYQAYSLTFDLFKQFFVCVFMI